MYYGGNVIIESTITLGKAPKPRYMKCFRTLDFACSPGVKSGNLTQTGILLLILGCLCISSHLKQMHFLCNILLLFAFPLCSPEVSLYLKGYGDSKAQRLRKPAIEFSWGQSKPQVTSSATLLEKPNH